jgi:AraC-like DNA-binding protein
MTVSSRVLAAGDGWRVHDVICTHGPQDRPFEEQHASVSIAAVTAGTFQYRTRQGAAMLVPGALLLGNAGACFECGHTHGTGDRCLAFHLTPGFFEAVACEVPGIHNISFTAPSLAPLPDLMPLFADAESAREDCDSSAFEELTLRIAVAAASLTGEAPPSSRRVAARDERRIAEAVRHIEREAHEPLTLTALARDANMSAYHFLRTFRRIVGMTPHQFVLRTRMHRAALRLRGSADPITAIAYENGFNDLSTFNRRFRRLMGMSPGGYRARGR